MMKDKENKKEFAESLIREYDDLKIDYLNLLERNKELKKQIYFYSEGMRIQEKEIEQLRKELLERSKND